MHLSTTNSMSINYVREVAAGFGEVSHHLVSADVDVADTGNQVEFVESELGFSPLVNQPDAVRGAYRLFVNVRENAWAVAVFRPALISTFSAEHV